MPLRLARPLLRPLARRCAPLLLPRALARPHPSLLLPRPAAAQFSQSAEEEAEQEARADKLGDEFFLSTREAEVLSANKSLLEGAQLSLCCPLVAVLGLTGWPLCVCGWAQRSRGWTGTRTRRCARRTSAASSPRPPTSRHAPLLPSPRWLPPTPSLATLFSSRNWG